MLMSEQVEGPNSFSITNLPGHIPFKLLPTNNAHEGAGGAE